MSEWYLLSAPLGVLAVMALFHFVGCQSFGGSDVAYEEKPDGKPDYPKTVSGETGLVSYWRFQELHASEPSHPPTPNMPVSGGTAKDEKGVNPGKYKSVIVQPPAQFKDSPTATGSLKLEAAGLLELGATSTAVSVDGGFIEVPFSNSLGTKSFTVEAMVFPDWSPSEKGLFRTVIALNTVELDASNTTVVKAFGFGVFAGPADPGTPGPDVWQVWLADGTHWKMIKDPARNLTLVDFTKTNYLAVTYDATSKKLNMYVYVEGIDLSTDLAHPISDVVTDYSPVADPSLSLLIGMHRTPVGNSVSLYHPFKGRMQEVAFYNIAVSVGRCPGSHVCAGLNL